jgi:hypothetical protein
LLAPALAQVKGGAGLYLLLGWVAALHLLARGWLERRLPDPSFAQDVRTGNFEQLRLAPLTAHGLLVQRGVPDMLFRAATQSVWLPVYAIVVGALGASLADACALWLLFSFANYFVLGLVSLILLIPSEEIEWILLCGLLAYALLLDGGRVRTAVSSSSLFSVMLALPIIGRVFLPMQMMATLPNLLPVYAGVAAGGVAAVRAAGALGERAVGVGALGVPAAQRGADGGGGRAVWAVV